jgi:diguanylate cyclase
VAIHFVLWALIGWLGQLPAHAPCLFWGCTVGFGASLIGRLWLHPFLPSMSQRKPGQARTLFLALILINPALWGIASAVSTQDPALATSAAWIWFVLTGVAASGGMTFSIDRLSLKAYVSLAALPPVAAMLLERRQDQLVPTAAALIFIVYIHRASKAVHADYWAAAHARQALQERAEQLERMSCTDALTQVSNRLHFDREVGTEWLQAKHNASSMTLIMIDIDHFKRINDSCGHAFGDTCLQTVAATLQACLKRPGDLLARYGGEEFVAMLPNTDARGGATVAARMQAAVAGLAIEHESRALKITCSFGVHTSASVAANGPASALELADQALYRAKQQGRNRVVVADQDSPAEASA